VLIKDFSIGILGSKAILGILDLMNVRRL